MSQPSRGLDGCVCSLPLPCISEEGEEEGCDGSFSLVHRFYSAVQVSAEPLLHYQYLATPALRRVSVAPCPGMLSLAAACSRPAAI
jgi:hypothetical protein